MRDARRVPRVPTAGSLQEEDGVLELESCGGEDGIGGMES